MTPAQQTEYFEQLFICSVLYEVYDLRPSHLQLNIATPWQTLLHSTMLEEHDVLGSVLIESL